ncbi:MAG TPA: hypothetical protein VJ859_03355 [Allosphingosinicella sp.]|nr:hypothetical protein [Allosphingosinicella sp.]
MGRLTLFRGLFWVALVFAFVMAVLPHAPELPGHPLDKVQHIVAFMVLTALGCWGYPRARLVAVAVWLSGFGASIELVQGLPFVHRDSDAMDWIADTLAIAFVLIVMALVRGRAKTRARSSAG